MHLPSVNFLSAVNNIFSLVFWVFSLKIIPLHRHWISCWCVDTLGIKKCAEKERERERKRTPRAFSRKSDARTNLGNMFHCCFSAVHWRSLKSFYIKLSYSMLCFPSLFFRLCGFIVAKHLEPWAVHVYACVRTWRRFSAIQAILNACSLCRQ